MYGPRGRTWTGTSFRPTDFNGEKLKYCPSSLLTSVFFTLTTRLLRLPIPPLEDIGQAIFYAALPTELRHPKADGETRTHDTRLNMQKEISIGSILF